MLGITGMIGSAWLFSALGAVGVMGPAAILSWIIAGIFFILMVFSFAELGGVFPFSGSLARYNHYTHGTISNYLLAWAYFIGAVTTVTTEAVAIVEYASAYLPWAWNSQLGVLTPLGVLVAAGLVLLFFAIQLVGVHVYGWFNRLITAWKLIIPTLTFILLLALYFRPLNVVKVPGGFFPYGTAAVFSGMITTGIVYAYEGFRQGLEYAGEAKNPQRDVPLGSILAILVTIAVYVLLQLAFIGGVNWTNANVSFGNWSALASSSWSAHPFYSELTATGIPILIGFAVLLLIDAIISPAGTLGVYVGTSARNMYGMSRVGYIPRFFSGIHKVFRTPWVALVASTIIAIAFLVPFPTWYQIMTLSAVATVYNYLTAGITNHALKRLAPDLRRPYRPPAWFVVYPVSFIVAALFIYWSGWTYVNAIIDLVVIGLPLLLLGPYRSQLGLTWGYATTFSV
ncbi:MAG: APC family permease, partial [Acidilobus sp.]